MQRGRLIKRFLMTTAWVFLLAAISSWAQNFGSLQGQVTDPTGAAVPNAKVEATDPATGASRTTHTDSSGSYILPQLRPGTYQVQFSRQGFKTLSQPAVSVLVSTPTTLDVRLEVGAVTESITVEATAAPLLNTSDASVGNPFGQREVENLPFSARNPVNLLTLQPGVVFTGNSDTDLLFQGATSDLDEREGVVNGVRGNQSNVTLDGVDANDWETQAPFTTVLPVTLDSLQEFRVTTTNANPTEGVSGGAQVALVTKSGANHFHGNLRWLYRTDTTSANDFFNNQAGLPRPKLIRNIGGGSLGGPILKDRIFFFFDEETRREASQAQALRRIPTETLKQGILTYAVRQDVPGFDPNAPGLFPCPNRPQRLCRQLTPADIQALDPAGLGVNPAMLAYMSQFPVGNDPAQGRDNGLNFTGFRFNAPIGTGNNIYNSRLDFKLTADGRHTVYVRGTLGDIKTDLRAAQFPGRQPNTILLNGSKGVAAGYTWLISPTLINTATYGFSRVGIEETGGKGPQFGVRSFDDATNFVRASGRKIPVNDIKDDVNWVLGTHTLQFGGTVRVIRDDRFSDALTFPSFFVNDGFCVNLCTDAFRALVGDSDPNNNPLDRTTFDRSFMMLIGAITQTNATFFVDPKSKTFLPAGTTPKRRFAESDVEVYFQDSWRVRPNLSLTLGLRYSYESPVWETRGAQVRPNIDVRTWFNQRMRDMSAGIPSDASDLLTFDLAGKANGTLGWWNPDTNNFAPRVGVAWSPGFKSGIGKAIFGGPGQSSIRLGGGIFFSRLGGPIAADTDVNGSFGLSTSLINGAGDFRLGTAPRFSGSCGASGCSGLPPLDLFFAAPTSAQFPAKPLSDFTNIGFLVDNRLSTPYSMNLSADFQRKLPKGLVLDVGYVGTLGRQLLVKTDLSQMFGFFKDPKSGQNIWGAYNQIVDLIGPDPFNPKTPVSQVPNIALFDNLLPNLPAFLGLTGDTPTQAFYELASAFAPDWGDALAFGIDTVAGGGFGSPWNTTVDPQQDGFVLYQPQFQALPAWVNTGLSDYHSFQFSLRRTTGNITYGGNYVFSKSIDLGSAAENSDLFTGLGQFNGQVPNPFVPQANRGVSDFDVRHNFNGFWVANLPFGQGQRFGSKVGRAMDALIGGWQFNGLARWRSGFPITPGNGFNFPTNFFLTGPGTLLGPLRSSVSRNAKGTGLPNLFQDPEAAKKLLGFTRPGSSGSRNAFRAPGFFTADLGITKNFRMPWSESQRLQVRMTAFNAFNNVNFNDMSINALDPDSGTDFGQFTGTAGPARRGGAREVEFSLRYEF